MKTVKLGDQIKRVNEKDAMILTRGNWEYCSKSEWKEKVRVMKPTKSEKKEKVDGENKRGKKSNG